MTTMSASEVFALVDDRKACTPPPQVTGDDHHEYKFCICTVVDDWKIHYIPAQMLQGQDHLGHYIYSWSRMQQPIASRTRVIARSR